MRLRMLPTFLTAFFTADAAGWPSLLFTPSRTSARSPCRRSIHQEWHGQIPSKGLRGIDFQLLGFGSEKHDDLVDAIVNLILRVAQDGIEQKVVHYV